MKISHPVVGALMGVAVLCSSAGGFAQVPDAASSPADQEAPGIDFDDVYESGRERYASGDYLGAISIWSRLARTLSEEETFKLHYSIALAHQNLGDATNAIEGLTRFIEAADRFGLPAGEEMMATDAKARLASLRATYAEIVFPAPQHGGTMLVKVGVQEPRVAGFTVYLSPGTHQIELDTGTPNARVQKITAQAGTRMDIDTNAIRPTPMPNPPVALPPQPFEPLRETPPPPPGSVFPLGIVIGLGSATVVSLALPIGFYVNASSARVEAENLGPRSVDYPEAQRDFDNARSAYEISWLAPAVLGAATLVITTVGLVQWAEASDQSEGRRSGPHLSLSDRGWRLQW